MRILLLLALLWPAILFADEEPTSSFVAQLGDNKLFLYPERCELGAWFVRWHKARWVFNGKSFDGCWTLGRHDGGIFVHTVDESGDTGSVPVAAFRKEEGI